MNSLAELFCLIVHVRMQINDYKLILGFTSLEECDVRFLSEGGMIRAKETFEVSTKSGSG